MRISIDQDHKGLIKPIRLQKLISQLEILGETISQEDMNLKFLRSLLSEWKSHTLDLRLKKINAMVLRPQGLNKSEVECYNIIKGPLARECKGFSQGEQEQRTCKRKGGVDSGNKQAKALVAQKTCDKFKTGIGFDSQVNDKYKTGEGYHAVPPPYTGNFMPLKPNLGNPQLELQEKGVIDSGCSRHMTGNKSYLSDYEEIDGGIVAYGRDPKGGKITGKDTECVVLSPIFKLLDENHVLLKVPRKDNMYSVDLKNIVHSGGFKPSGEEEKKDAENLENEDSKVPNIEEPRVNQEQDEIVNIYGCVDDPNMPNLEEIVYSDNDEDVDAEADMTNLDTHILNPKKRAIGTKWIYRNKKDERGIVVRNKARLVAQGYTQEEGIDYDEGLKDPSSLTEFIRVEKAQYGYINAPRSCQHMETSKSLMKDENAEDVDVHLYRSMIGSLMYLTSSRPDIMFAVCAYARFQVTPKVSHLHAMKRIFRYDERSTN
ncbi:retrovirus-related pol polyprotein from transposon TNT 1-94 [Tanacetum coccineum]